MGEFKNIAGHFAVLFSFFSTAILAVDGPTPEECWASYVKMNRPGLIFPEEPEAHDLTAPARFQQIETRRQLIFAPDQLGIPRLQQLDKLLKHLPLDDGITIEGFQRIEEQRLLFDSSRLLGQMGFEKSAYGLFSEISNRPGPAEASWNIALKHLVAQHKHLQSLRGGVEQERQLLNAAEKIANLREIPTQRGELETSEGPQEMLIYGKKNDFNGSPGLGTQLVYAPIELRDAEGGFIKAYVDTTPGYRIFVSHHFARTNRFGPDEKHEIRHLRWEKLMAAGTPSIFSGFTKSLGLPLPRPFDYRERTEYSDVQSDEEGPNYGLGLRDHLPQLTEAKRQGHIAYMMKIAEKTLQEAILGLGTTLRTQAVANVLQEHILVNGPIQSANPGVLINNRLHIDFLDTAPFAKAYAFLEVLKPTNEGTLKKWFRYILPLKENDEILHLREKAILFSPFRLSRALSALAHRFKMKEEAAQKLEAPLEHIRDLANAYVEHPTIQNYEALEIGLRETKFPRVRTLVGD